MSTNLERRLKVLIVQQRRHLSASMLCLQLECFSPLLPRPANSSQILIGTVWSRGLRVPIGIVQRSWEEILYLAARWKTRRSFFKFQCFVCIDHMHV
jgi:hypothetical protein